MINQANVLSPLILRCQPAAGLNSLEEKKRIKYDE